MNHLFRLVFSKTSQTLVPVAEMASCRGKGGTRRRRHQSKSAGGPIQSRSVWAGANILAWSMLPQISLAQPNLDYVVSGSATAIQTGSELTINQTSDQAILNWRSFDIAAGERVNFVQPNADSVALNRVQGINPSAIFGQLDANGQVFLVNPNGIYFAPGAQVNVGGLVASTLNISDADFLNRNYHFAGGSSAAIRNDGSIKAAEGGYVAFVGNTVSNQGSIAAHGGSAALGAGGSVQLTMADNHLLSFEVDGSAYQALADNGGLIQADGGKVFLSSQAKDSLFSTVVNNTGIIRAQTVANQEGSIVLLGGASGTAQVAGTLDASAPNGGNGGFIETSGQQLKVADGTTITTKAATGASGNWLIDPVDFTIASGSGALTTSGIGADTLQTSLGSSNVTITTDASTSGNGDIIVNAPVTWSANTLTLSAHRNIDINAAMTATNTAGLSLQYGQGAVAAGNGATYNVNAPVNLASTGSFSTKLGSDGVTANYTIITSLGAAGSTTGTDLQGMNGGLAGNYVLGANIDASDTSGWNNGAGFVPIGNSATKFTGNFDGLGHTITRLTINRPSTDYIGLFGFVNSAAVGNLGLVNGSVTGRNYSGSLVGRMDDSTVLKSYANGVTISARSFAGGLVGSANGSSSITNSYSTGNVTQTGSDGVAGGLLGSAGYEAGSVTISNSYATGAVSGTQYVGGLVGSSDNDSNISNSYATGAVTGTRFYIGGLTGYLIGGVIEKSYATGSVSGPTDGVADAFGNPARGSYVGGLTGQAWGATIRNSYATGSVTGTDQVGGFIGQLAATNNIQNNYSTGALTGASKVGGFIGGDYTGWLPAGQNAVVKSTFTNNFFDATAYAGHSVGDRTTSVSGITGKTTTELKQASTFSGWDLSTTGGSTKVWRIYEGNTTPLLRNFLTAYSIADVTRQYTGAAQTGTTASGTNILGSAATGTDVGTYYGYYSSQQGYDISGGTLEITPRTSSDIYLRLLLGSSGYGSYPVLRYGLYTDAAGGTLVTDAEPSGTPIWRGAPTSGSSTGHYSVEYVEGITLGNSDYTLLAGDPIEWTVTFGAGIPLLFENGSKLQPLEETPLNKKMKVVLADLANTANTSTIPASFGAEASFAMPASPERLTNVRQVADNDLVFAGSQAMRILEIVDFGVNGKIK